jgi:hypothetical protein
MKMHCHRSLKYHCVFFDSIAVTVELLPANVSTFNATQTDFDASHQMMVEKSSNRHER